MNKMNGFISQGTMISLCLFAPATVRTQEPDKQPPPIGHASQTIPKKSEAHVPFEERLLGTVPTEYEGPPVVRGGPIFLDNPAQWAFVAPQNRKAIVVSNTKKGPQFDEINVLFHNPAVRTIVYNAPGRDAREE